MPERQVGQHIIVARPEDGAAVMLSEAASVVWALMDDWTSVDDLVRAISIHVPDLGRTTDLAGEIWLTVASLGEEGLVERRGT